MAVLRRDLGGVCFALCVEDDAGGVAFLSFCDKVEAESNPARSDAPPRSPGLVSLSPQSATTFAVGGYVVMPSRAVREIGSTWRGSVCPRHDLH